VTGASSRRRRRYPKRLFDAVAAGLSLLILWPVILAVAALVRLRLGSPIFFRQLRPGLRGQPFTLIKFRTMRDLTDEEGRPASDAERLTPFGRLLRSTSLDELPELWNVLKGDMSLVGPRPLLMHYLELYTPFQMRRHEVRPGLTGWAQVNGRNALSWPEKFALDVDYVDSWSFALDMKIILLTVANVFRRHGISAEGEATTAYFRGERDPRLERPTLGATSSTAGEDR
jgi:lipopolysaccharide/colanic/teichoic acid biosynthesis glycosyltransferase